MNATTQPHDHIISLLFINAREYFDGSKPAGSQVALPLGTALNRMRCGLVITAGAGALVELVEFKGAETSVLDGVAVASLPMVKDISAAAAWVNDEAEAWMAANA